MQIKYGVISDVKTGYAKVFFAEDNISTDWWPVLRRTSLKDKESWPLNVQEHVACICDVRMEDGVILGAIHNDQDAADSGAGATKFRKVFEDGTILEYDKGAHQLTATVKGKADIIADNDVTVNSQTKIKAIATVEADITAPLVKITGNLTITGNLAFGGTMSGPSGSGFSFSSNKLNVKDIDATGDVKAGAISLKDHVHGGVQTGGGTTGLPQ